MMRFECSLSITLKFIGSSFFFVKCVFSGLSNAQFEKLDACVACSGQFSDTQIPLVLADLILGCFMVGALAAPL
jgi:hypothetical protein